MSKTEELYELSQTLQKDPAVYEKFIGHKIEYAIGKMTRSKDIFILVDAEIESINIEMRLLSGKILYDIESLTCLCRNPKSFEKESAFFKVYVHEIFNSTSNNSEFFTYLSESYKLKRL